MLTNRELAIGKAAARAGHPEWAGLPMTMKQSQGLKKVYFFTGRPCAFGHIARRFTHDGRCVECVLPTPPDESPEQFKWNDRFSHLADRIEVTGRLHYYKKVGAEYRVIATVRVVPKFDNLRAACSKAAMFTVRDGALRCVMPGATRWVVKKMSPPE